jgi:hypothetical protein
MFSSCSEVRYPTWQMLPTSGSAAFAGGNSPVEVVELGVLPGQAVAVAREILYSSTKISTRQFHRVAWVGDSEPSLSAPHISYNLQIGHEP